MSTTAPDPENESAVTANDASAAEPEEVFVVEETVRVERSVRYGRVVVGTAILGALVATFLTLAFPVASKEYTLGQVVGFMALVGAAIGLALGAVLSLILTRVARRQQGTAVAKHSDVG